MIDLVKPYMFLSRQSKKLDLIVHFYKDVYYRLTSCRLMV